MWKSALITFNEIVKSQGITVAVVLVLAAALMYDKHQTDQRNVERIHYLEVEIRNLNQWRIDQLTGDRETLIQVIQENTNILREVKEHLE